MADSRYEAVKATALQLALAVVVLGLLAIPFPMPQAQPVRTLVLETLRAEPVAGGHVLRLGLAFPVRVLRHFPPQGGDELRVRVEPLQVGETERDAVREREAMTAPPEVPVPLTEVVWEGDAEGGPFVTFRFARPVTWSVAPGADFRGVAVTVREAAPSAP